MGLSAPIKRNCCGCIYSRAANLRAQRSPSGRLAWVEGAAAAGVLFYFGGSGFGTGAILNRTTVSGGVLSLGSAVLQCYSGPSGGRFSTEEKLSEGDF